MISTCSHKNYNSNIYKTYAISGNRGKDANYSGECFMELAPKLSFWKIWHDNIGILSEEENNQYYIEEYYKQVLSKLDPEEICNKLGCSILLCYEENTEFCHRHIVAEWIEILLGIRVPEVKVNGCLIQEIERPDYIGSYLEEVMKKAKNMKGFNSLRALYLFEKANAFELKADELEEKTGRCYDGYRQEACFLRCDADESESEYKNSIKIKAKTK